MDIGNTAVLDFHEYLSYIVNVKQIKVKDMEWTDINIEQPKMGDEIYGVTSVGKMKGSYISGNTFRTKDGLFSFTKWKPKTDGRIRGTLVTKEFIKYIV